MRLAQSLYVPAALTLLLASSASAHDQKSAVQNSVVPAPQAILDALKITEGSVQNLTLNTSGEWDPFQVEVVFSGRTWTLELEPYTVFAPGFKLRERMPNGELRELPTPLPTTYRGVVQGIPGSSVAANLFEGQLNATIALPGTSWTVQPATDAIAALPRSMHVVYNDDRIVPLPDFCPVEHGDAQPAAPGGGAPESALRFADLAVELNPNFRTIWGGTSGAVNQASQIISGANLIYERDCNVFFRLREVVIGPNYGTNSTNVLSLYRNRWLSTSFPFVYDVSHLFMGSPSSGVIGIAYINGVCNSNRFSVSWHTSNLTTRRAVFAHEVGHVFNAQHCNGINPCRIMCSSIGGCGPITSFAPVSINAIVSKANSASCLSNN